MTKRKLKKLLRKCQKVRNEWCKEYTKVRDELAAIRKGESDEPWRA